MMTAKKTYDYVRNYYLEHKSNQLGIFFDALLNVYDYEYSEAEQMFLNSKYSNLIEENDATVVLGLTGLDLYNKIQWESTYNDIDYSLYDSFRYFYKSETYWAGWILAYYQDFSKKSFKEILSKIPIKTIESLYYPLHEADVTKAYREFDKYMK